MQLLNKKLILSKLNVLIFFLETFPVAPLQIFAAFSLHICCSLAFTDLFSGCLNDLSSLGFSISAAKVHQLSDPLNFPPTPSGGISVFPSPVPYHCHDLGSAGSSGKPVAGSGCCPLAHDAFRYLGQSRGPASGGRSHERGDHSPNFSPQRQWKPHPSSPPKHCPWSPAVK